MLSTGDEQSLHWGLDPLSIASLSPVRKSPLKNLMCRRSLGMSCVLLMFRRAGWGTPDNPRTCTFKYLIFELDSASALKNFSYQTVTLVVVKVDHLSFSQVLLESSSSGLGSLYFWQSVLRCADQVLELEAAILRR